MSNLAEILSAIDGLQSHEEIKLIFDAANARGRTIRANAARINVATIKVGDRVRTKNLKPKYLNDNVGTVVPSIAGLTRPTDIRVEFPLSIGRYGKVINIPASSLDVV